MLDCLLILFGVAMSQTALCLFSLSRFIFVGATSPVLFEVSRVHSVCALLGGAGALIVEH